MPLNQAGPEPIIWWGKNVVAKDETAASSTKGVRQASNLYKMLENILWQSLFSFRVHAYKQGFTKPTQSPMARTPADSSPLPQMLLLKLVFANGGKSSRNCQECRDMSGHSCTT